MENRLIVNNDFQNESITDNFTEKFKKDEVLYFSINQDEK